MTAMKSNAFYGSTVLIHSIQIIPLHTGKTVIAESMIFFMMSPKEGMHRDTPKCLYQPRRDCTASLGLGE